MNTSLTQMDWRKISNDFKEQRCIFFLGPGISEMSQTDSSISTDQALAIHISEVLDEFQINYDKNSQSKLSYVSQQFLNIPNARRVDLEDTVRQFYKDHINKVPESYHTIAEFPVSIVINTIPNDFMAQAFIEKGKAPVSQHYNFRLNQFSKRNLDQNSSINFSNIGPDRPLIFNLFGHLDYPESLVLTLEDQMEFIRNVVKGDPKIPAEILSYFDRRKTYILLGFDAENWQFRLLLDSLNLQSENTTILQHTNGQLLSSMTQIFYEKRFNCTFMSSQLNQFAAQLKENTSVSKAPINHNILITSHDQDRDILNRLTNAMSPWQQSANINIWHTGKFQVGKDKQKVLAEQYEKATVVLFLLSSDFLADESKMYQELYLAINKKKQGNAILIPLVVRACDWLSHPFLRKLNPIPENGEPLESSHWNSLDEVIQTVVQQIKKRLR